MNVRRFSRRAGRTTKALLAKALIVTPVLVALGLVASLVAAGTGRIELGICRSNLTLQSEDVRRQTLTDIATLHAIWFRDAVSSSSAKGVANVVDEIGLAKQQGLKVLLQIVQLDGDFAGDNATSPTNSCGWKEKRLSQVDPARVKKRVTALLSAIKAANLSVEAFEIGNEDDSYCYDPDVPKGHMANAEELQTVVSGYAKFLLAVATTIKEPSFFPEAKLVTFGIAHGCDQCDQNHISSPARIIAMLKDVNGVNYLDNPGYRIDGYGTHIYPSPNGIREGVTETLQQDVSILGRDRPFWVTEWGFLNVKAFPNKKGQTFSSGIDQFIDTFIELKKSIPIGPMMYYSYEKLVADPAGRAAGERLAARSLGK